jgi:aldose 1-epimerase
LPYGGDFSAVIEATPGHDVRRSSIEGFETWTLNAHRAEVEATFAPGAGMVGCSLRHRGEELLELGNGLAAYARAGATMGIPLLYPWANRLAGFDYSVGGRTVALDRDSPLIQLEENGLPIHGLLGGCPHWRVREAKADPAGAMLAAELDFGAHGDLLAAFPFPHVLRIEVTLHQSTLAIGTTVIPTGDVAVPIAFGYHPYLRLPGAPRERWQIVIPARCRLVLDDRMIPTGAEEPVHFEEEEALGERAFDDAFAELEPGMPFSATAAGRKLAVSFSEGYPYAQVYSPPGADFICFEPMSAPTNALRRGGEALRTVRRPESFSARFSISIVEA